MNASGEEMVKISRVFMLSLTVVGILIALTHPKLLWLSLIYGSLASAGFFPFIFSVYFRNIPPKALILSICLALIVGLPMSIYANILENTDLIVYSALLSFFIGLPVCLIGVMVGERGLSKVKK